MFKSLNFDRENIENKYHKKNEPYNAYNRMDYHGYDYDESTGLSDKEIDAGLAILSQKLEGLAHPIIKAKLFEYVLQNTRIDVNERDYFIGMYTWNRPISKYCIHKWSKEIYDSFPEQSQLLGDYDKSGLCFGWLDFDHTVPDWDSLIELGFSGILARAKKSFEQIQNPTQKQKDFYEAMTIVYNAVIFFIDRLYKYSLTKSFEKASIISSSLKNLRDGAPKNTYDVLQLIYIYFMVGESVDHYQIRSLGHGLDSTLYPFFKNDIQNGTFTKEEIAEFLGYFLMQWSSIDNYWGQPFYLAGTNLDGSTKVNELSYLILDIYEELGIYNPKIQIKYGKSTPKDFILKALEAIRNGNSSIVFCNEDIITKSLMSRGTTYEDALDSVISGCYEYKAKAKDIGISLTYYCLLKPVSLVIDNGFDDVTGKQLGVKTGELCKLDSFEKFYNAYLTQLKHTLLSFLNAINTLETKVNDVNPSMLFSATCKDCVATMTDAIDGGLENTTDVLVSGLGSAVDSLMAIRELVYESNITTLETLKAAVDNNWVGYEFLRAKAQNCKHKYGNGDPISDNYAAAIIRFVSDLISGKKNSHGGRVNLEAHSARAFIWHGENMKATPDGRLAGEETSKNASPAPGSDKNGITALINSATTIDTVLCNNGFCLDAMLHPSAILGENGLSTFYAILDTYMKKGGGSIHFNIFDTNVLRDAQIHPEKYQNLQVRVCGWNVLWVNMSKQEQDAYIKRAESNMN